MENKNWHGIMKVVEIQHIRNNETIWQAQNLKNLLHNQGEQFILSTMFYDHASFPTAYYVGLDNRTSLTVTDTLNSLVSEPSGNGYLRQQILSTGQFVVAFDNASHHYVANGPIITFGASGGSWGPATNLFLSTSADNSGKLISSVELGNPLTLNASDTVTLRVSFQLQDLAV